MSVDVWLGLYAPLYMLTAALGIVGISHYTTTGDWRVWRFFRLRENASPSERREHRVFQIMVVLTGLLFLINAVLILT